MRLRWASTLLPFLFNLSHGQMQIWPDSEGSSPVFFSQTSVTDVDEFSGNRFQALYDIAQVNFDDVNQRSDAPTRDGNLLVAALWHPQTSTVYASTIPRGDAFYKFVKNNAQTRTPVWWSRAGSNFLHAEDGAYFLMEYVTRLYAIAATVVEDPDTQMGIANTKYASGSKIVVWGYLKSDSASVKGAAPGQGMGRRVGLCGTPGATDTNKPRNPTCRTIASRLGVDPDPNINDEYSEDLDDDDFLAGCSDTVLVPLDPPPPGAPGQAPGPAAKIKARQAPSAAGTTPAAGSASGYDAAVTTGSDWSMLACPLPSSTITVSVSYDPTPLSITLPLDTETGACTGACLAAATTAAATAAMTTTFQTVVATPTTSYGCSYYGDSPGNGVTSAFCVCSQGQSTIIAALPRNSAGIAEPSGTNSCPYTAWPGTATINPTTTLGPATTNMAACQVCWPAVVNEDSCTSITGCTPQGAVATVSVGSSPVNVGTLTGTALYTSVSSALESICPSVTQTTALTECSGSATVPNIAYASGDDLATDGELLVTADLSGYNTTQIRDALIISLATSAQQAATGNNCYVPEGSAGVGDPAPNPKDTFCNSAWFYEADYFNPWWRQAANPGPTDFIHATIEFHTVPQTILQFVCDFIDIAIDALALVEPEFIVEDAELEEGINLICQDNEGKESTASTPSGSNPNGTT